MSNNSINVATVETFDTLAVTLHPTSKRGKDIRSTDKLWAITGPASDVKRFMASEHGGLIPSTRSDNLQHVKVRPEGARMFVTVATERIGVVRGDSKPDAGTRTLTVAEIVERVTSGDMSHAAGLTILIEVHQLPGDMASQLVSVTPDTPDTPDETDAEIDARVTQKEDDADELSDILGD